MKDGTKEKKGKKKNIKKENLIEFEEEIKMESIIVTNDLYYPQMEVEQNSITINNNIILDNLSIDASQQKEINLIGCKGHQNFISKQSVITGTYYFEVQVTSVDYNFNDYVYSRRTDEITKKYYEPVLQNFKSYVPNIRIGFIKNLEDKEIPIGAGEKSYGYRATDGVLINEGEYLNGNENFTTGDIIGALIHLKPPKPKFLKDTEESEKNSECFIKFYKNGIEQNIQFKAIYEGEYFAAVTLYNFSQVNLNFGPKFKFMNLEENRSIKGFCEIV